MNANDIGTKLVQLCKEGKNRECLDTLYAADVESVEAFAPPGGDRMAKGLDALRGKLEWWTANHEIHAAETHGPYPHGHDRFATRFVYDITHKPSGRRHTLDEVAMFTVANGKIVREEFFYPAE